MNSDLTELAENFSLSEMRPASVDPRALAQKLLQLLEAVTVTLSQVKAKFVDIDTSFKEVDSDQAAHFQQVVGVFQDTDLLADLADIHEALSLYLIIKDRFGEAADWNLKVEFQGRLSLPVFNSSYKLKKIISP